jgi:hypothetical protein
MPLFVFIFLYTIVTFIHHSFINIRSSSHDILDLEIFAQCTQVLFTRMLSMLTYFNE